MTTIVPSEDNWMTDDIGVSSTIEEWSQQHPWKILIVDDEPDVHSMTRLALRDVTYRGRPLALYSAYSAAEGYALLERHPDTAIVLLDVVMETGQASVSMLQRRLKLGYSRAARIVDEMETRGIVGPFEGSKPRQLLITKEQWQELKMKGAYGATPPEAEELPPPDEEN